MPEVIVEGPTIVGAPEAIPTAGLVSSVSCDDIPPPKPDFFAPPPYEVATKLPTYEEVQREKHLEEQNISSTDPQNPRVSFTHLHFTPCN